LHVEKHKLVRLPNHRTVFTIDRLENISPDLDINGRLLRPPGVMEGDGIHIAPTPELYFPTTKFVQHRQELTDGLTVLAKIPHSSTSTPQPTKSLEHTPLTIGQNKARALGTLLADRGKVPTFKNFHGRLVAGQLSDIRQGAMN
jgi:hypothetical protein